MSPYTEEGEAKETQPGYANSFFPTSPLTLIFLLTNKVSNSNYLWRAKKGVSFCQQSHLEIPLSSYPVHLPSLLCSFSCISSISYTTVNRSLQSAAGLGLKCLSGVLGQSKDNHWVVFTAPATQKLLVYCFQFQGKAQTKHPLYAGEQG